MTEVIKTSPLDAYPLHYEPLKTEKRIIAYSNLKFGSRRIRKLIKLGGTK